MNSSTDDQEAENEKHLNILKKHVSLTSEHSDSVQIIAVKHSVEGTTSVGFGSGDFYSRYGAIKDWVVKQERKFK